ncbi:hypothetical protein FB45DRAFT_1118014 [Roridomyces roridus]|uniref:MYND-type domain-containing protein n=1 Tax=Roridomyces roridus TaxID=1738132 RepID=A0AAD7B6M6_9AGAR|nr:hypothetical protein FB45DRAFT_1118014 [Roridomyces roridus]
MEETIGSQRQAFLAAFFPVLDPARIPHLEEFSANSKAKEDIACADVAVNAMFDIPNEGDIGLSLWPRVWPWVDFIHTHRQHLEDRIDFLPEIVFYSCFIIFVGLLSDHEATRQLIFATPGFWACLTKSWTFLTQLNIEIQGFVVFTYIGRFIVESSVRSRPERLEEMIDAAGSINHFAGLVVDFIRTVLKYCMSDLTRSPLDHIEYLMLFLDDADQFPKIARMSAYLCPSVHWVSRLRLRTRTGRRVGDGPMSTARTAYGHYIFGEVLAQQLERGLLRALMLITLHCHARAWKLENHVLFFLDHLIPGGLVYFDAVAACRDALKEVQDLRLGLLGDDLKRRAPVLYGTWQRFLATAEERCGALTKYKSPSFRARKACDSQTCDSILESSCLKRCSGCRAFYYCSVECQRNDWELGHKNACRTHHKLLLSTRAALAFSERSFLRVLTHHKYLEDRRSICAEQIRVLSRYDSVAHLPNPLFTLFDYSQPSPVITVYPVDLENAKTRKRLHEFLDTKSEECKDLVKRAKLGKGRYQLHGIRVSEGSKMRTWVVPLRTDGEELFAGLVRLSQKMCRGLLGEAALMGEIDFLLESTDNVVEIH